MDPVHFHQSPIINNQFQPSANPQATQLSLKSVSTFIICPGCSSLGVTKTVPKLNIVSTLLSVFCYGCWWIYQSCNGKEFNCYDTSHTCLRCGREIGKYVSC